MNLGRWAITVAACSAVALMLGIWAGGLMMPSPGRAARSDSVPAAPASGATDEHAPPPTSAMLHVPMTAEIDSYAVEEEVRLAYSSGVRRFIIDLRAPWVGEESHAVPLRTSVLATLDDISIALSVDLNPPPSWRQAHAEDCLSVNGESLLPLPWSELWRGAVADGIAGLRLSLAGTGILQRIDSLIVRGLSEGGWTLPIDFDRAVCVPAFRAWLMNTYATVGDLNAAWHSKLKSFEDVVAAPLPATEATLLDLPGQFETIAFRHFLADTANDAAGYFASTIRASWGGDVQILFEAGAAFEAGP
ncbi:MAG: hypothetical protein AAB353_04925, partial [Candidatus Hydrogenedentota bacterium]